MDKQKETHMEKLEIAQRRCTIKEQLDKLLMDYLDDKQFEFARLTVDIIASLEALKPPTSFNELTADEKALIEAGRVINAIKEFRARTGFSLREAKETCDAYRDGQNLVTP
jgi:hypothetical protein